MCLRMYDIFPSFEFVYHNPVGPKIILHRGPPPHPSPRTLDPKTTFQADILSPQGPGCVEIAYGNVSLETTRKLCHRIWAYSKNEWRNCNNHQTLCSLGIIYISRDYTNTNKTSGNTIFRQVTALPLFLKRDWFPISKHVLWASVLYKALVMRGTDVLPEVSCSRPGLAPWQDQAMFYTCCTHVCNLAGQLCV